MSNDYEVLTYLPPFHCSSTWHSYIIPGKFLTRTFIFNNDCSMCNDFPPKRKIWNSTVVFVNQFGERGRNSPARRKETRGRNITKAWSKKKENRARRSHEKKRKQLTVSLPLRPLRVEQYFISRCSTFFLFSLLSLLPAVARPSSVLEVHRDNKMHRCNLLGQKITEKRKLAERKKGIVKSTFEWLPNWQGNSVDWEERNVLFAFYVRHLFLNSLRRHFRRVLKCFRVESLKKRRKKKGKGKGNVRKGTRFLILWLFLRVYEQKDAVYGRIAGLKKLTLRLRDVF